MCGARVCDGGVSSWAGPGGVWFGRGGVRRECLVESNY